MSRTDRLDPRYINRHARLPYGLEVSEVEEAVAATYRLIYGINEYLEREGFPSLQKLILGNSLSGILSEFMVKNIGTASAALVANVKVGGHPDLLPVNMCTPEELEFGALKKDQGLEVKTSTSSGGWQGHNPEDCHLMVFRYEITSVGEIVFQEILCAQLVKDDWSFSGRKGASRRTPTASITASGVEKLRSNFLYRLPGVGVGRHRDILADSQ